MKTAHLALAAFVAAISFSAVAQADGGPKIRDSLWLPVGMNLGYSVNPDPLSNGFLAGPEVSLVYLDDSGPWGGVYTDVLRDFGSDATRLSAGVEAGYAIFGVDLGYVASFHDGFDHGYRGRFMFSLAVIHFYGGVGQVLASPDSLTYGEVGMLLKIPITLWEDEASWQRRRYHPPPEDWRLPPRTPEPVGEPPRTQEPAPPPPEFAQPPPP